MAKTEKDTQARSLRDEVPGSVPLTGSVGELYKWETAGQRIEGRYQGMKDGSMGGQILTIETRDGLLSASAPTMLENALRDVAPGTLVVIRYLGEQPSKKGGTFKAFEAIAVPKK